MKAARHVLAYLKGTIPTALFTAMQQMPISMPNPGLFILMIICQFSVLRMRIMLQIKMIGNRKLDMFFLSTTQV